MTLKLVVRQIFAIVAIAALVGCGRQAGNVTLTTKPTLMPVVETLTVPPANIADLPTPQFPTPPPLGEIPAATLTPMPTITSAPTRTLVPYPFRVLEGLRVVYDIGGDLYVQDSGKQVIQLTHSGQDDRPMFSGDGRKIVFYRGEGNNQLWTINADGTGEQELINPVQLATFGQEYNELTELRSLVFVPGTYLLLFNTHLYRGERIYPPELNNDLFLVNTDTAEIKQLLAPEQGGEFLVSPDGKRIAVQTGDHIDVIDLQGQIMRHNLATYPVYTPPAKVPMAWMPDSKELIVLPSQFDPLTAGIPVLRKVWRYSLDGSSGSEIRLDPPPIDNAFRISPDGNWIAYSYHPSELDPDAKSGVYLGNLRDGTSRLIFTLPLTASGFPEPIPLYYDWTPDSVSFSCYYEEVYMGNIRGEITSLGLVGLRESPAWIDGKRYLLEGGSVLVEIGKQERFRVVEIPPGALEPSSFVFLKR